MRVALGVVAVLLLAGCSSPHDTIRDGEADLAHFESVEVKLSLKAEQEVSWSWTTQGGPVELNLHQHENGATQVFAQKTATQGSGNYTATKDGTYFVLWQNMGNATVTLDYHVQTNGKVVDVFR